MFSKSLKGIFVLGVIIFLMAVSIVQPVSATTPEELNFTVEHVYIVPTDSTMFGVWESSGVLESSGEIYESYFWAGWNEDWWFVKNLHTEITLSDANGTIKIKAHVHENDFEPFGLMDYEGSWVIVEGTGDYAGLHGRGTVDFEGMFYWSCPPNDYGIGGPCIVGTETYTGQGHFDP